MINLLKNEFIKSFHKKGIIILLIISVLFCILTNILYKTIDSLSNTMYDLGDSYVKEDYELAKESYEEDKSSDNKEWYVSSKVDYDVYNIKSKYEKDSWQRAYIVQDEELSDLVSIIDNYELGVTKDKEEYDKAKKDLDDFVYKLDNSDWKDIVNEQLNEVNLKLSIIDSKNKDEDSKKEASEKEISEEELYYESLSDGELKIEKENLNIQKEVLELQLEKNISYADTTKYNNLQGYRNSKIELLNYKNLDKLDEKQKEQYYYLRENYFNFEYKLKYDKTAEITLKETLVSFFNDYSLMIVIFIFMISGSIVSQEFNKGTIKLLLVKPYSRIKLLLSKYIVSLSSIFIGIFIMFIIQLIVGGIFFGFDSLSSKVVVYSNLSDSVSYIGIFQYTLLNIISLLPKFILLSTLAFAASTIFNNTALAIITGFVGYMGTDILGAILSSIDKPFIKYFIGYNWDLSPYIFNSNPVIKGLTLVLSIIICIIYLLILIIPSFIVFKNRDIKNI